jgi:hypothetical protein
MATALPISGSTHLWHCCHLSCRGEGELEKLHNADSFSLAKQKQILKYRIPIDHSISELKNQSLTITTHPPIHHTKTTLNLHLGIIKH